MTSSATFRYNRRVLALSVVYGICLLGSVYGFKHKLLSGALAWLVAASPALPIVGMFAAIGRYLADESDEYLRMLVVRKALWASGIAISIATIWGFLESFDMVGHVEAYDVAILWFGSLGLGALASRLTYGRNG